MAKKRAAERDIDIPLPANIDQRVKCLEDPERFLKTYFAETFFQPFTPDRLAMMQSIVDAAKHGGDYALAGPRGEGKTRLALYLSIYLMLADLSPFPIVIGKSQTKAQNELKTVKERLQQSEELRADFPEVCVPFHAVGAWSSRARMQTVQGVHTNIEIAADHFIFPTIKQSQLPDKWPIEIASAAKGQIMSSMGVDGPIRGTNYRDRRPTLAIIDDMEGKKSATSDTMIEANEDIIEKDIGGLGGSGVRVSRVMLCTTQNRKCIAYKYTDPKQKPSWKGRRFRKMIKRPDRMDLWEEYISKRKERDQDDDPDARDAHRFYCKNREAMDAGCEISNPYSFDRRLHSDGEPVEVSAIQAYFNRVSDVGEEAVATEDDNDPPAEAGPQGNGLNPNLVWSRLSGLSRLQLPANTTALTASIDLGKHACHWVVTAWWKGAGGVIVDYGVAEVLGNDRVHSRSKAEDMAASEPQIYRCLLQWRDELLAKDFVDATGEKRRLDLVLVDSGAYTNAAYEFVRQVQGPFKPSKGIANYRPRKQSSTTCSAGLHIHAQYLSSQNVWLYELDTNHWKQWVHERFLTPTFDEKNMLRRGSLSLFEPEGNKKHVSFAQHVCSEELVREFKEGKGVREYWHTHNQNNHWLDATYMAAACTEAVGVTLLQETPEAAKVKARTVDGDDKKKTKPKPRQHGKFRTRPGGWMQGVRRRRG